MKKLLFITLALSLPVAPVVRADNDSDNSRPRKRQAPAGVEHRTPQAVRQPVRPLPRQAAPLQRPAARTPRTVVPVPRRTDFTEQNSRPSTPTVHRENNVSQSINGGRTIARPAARSTTRPPRRFDPNSFAVARSRVSHVPHDQSWWRRHYHTTFVLFGGGYYYWDAGYWYPAYGYSPIYNTYAYDEPIYGYNNLAPGEVLENVQLALRDLGYYQGPIDGLIGPETRAALAAFQQDNGLAVTAAVDEPTLVTLGLA